jgi:hypothetical protein
MPAQVGGNGLTPMHVIGIGVIGLGMITASSAAKSVLRVIAVGLSER